MSSNVPGSSGFQATKLARRGLLVHAGSGVLAVAVLGQAAGATDDEAGTAQALARSGFAAGLARHGVRHVLVTHAHGDHAGGLVSQNGRPARLSTLGRPTWT